MGRASIRSDPNRLHVCGQVQTRREFHRREDCSLWWHFNQSLLSYSQLWPGSLLNLIVTYKTYDLCCDLKNEKMLICFTWLYKLSESHCFIGLLGFKTRAELRNEQKLRTLVFIHVYMRVWEKPFWICRDYLKVWKLTGQRTTGFWFSGLTKTLFVCKMVQRGFVWHHLLWNSSSKQLNKLWLPTRNGYGLIMLHMVLDYNLLSSLEVLKVCYGF